MSGRRHRAGRWLATGVTIALVVACSSDTDDPNEAVATRVVVAETTNPAAEDEEKGDVELRTSGVPRLEERACPDGVPTIDRVRCLTLVVPETRGVAANGERLVRLPVVVIEATDPHGKKPDPVLWVDYDAGDGFLVGRARIFTDSAHSLNEHRDVITLDLRGSGGAEPSLDCQEVTELNVGAFATDVDETSREGRALRLDAIGRCRQRLVAEGVELSAYASDDAAADLEDLRLTLGVEQWNIVAGEYGSKLAQLLIRDHPATVRSVVINATPIPLQADWFADLAPNASRAWSALVSRCDADAGCATAFPDLAARLEALVADLTDDPRRYDEVQLDGGQRAPYLFTASRLLAYVRFYGRDSNFLAQLPMSIAGPKGGSASVLQTLDPDDPATLRYPASDVHLAPSYGVWQLIPHDANTDQGSHSLGAHLSAVCRDEAPFTDTRRLADASAVPLFGSFLGRHGDLAACRVWDVPAAAPDANETVQGDVPTLVLAGELDTVSSPAWADAFTEGLTAALVVHFPGTGTQPTGGQPTPPRRALASYVTTSSTALRHPSTTPASPRREVPLSSCRRSLLARCATSPSTVARVVTSRTTADLAFQAGRRVPGVCVCV